MLRLRTAQHHGDFRRPWKAQLPLTAQPRYQLLAAKAIVVLGGPLETVFSEGMRQRGQPSIALPLSIHAPATPTPIALQ